MKRFLQALLRFYQRHFLALWLFHACVTLGAGWFCIANGNILGGVVNTGFSSFATFVVGLRLGLGAKMGAKNGN